MSAASDRFVERVQENRGKIKSKKYVDMLEDIYDVGSNASKAQVEQMKLLGITFVHQVVISLSVSEQDDFWLEYMDSPIKNITNARLLLLKYV